MYPLDHINTPHAYHVCYLIHNVEVKPRTPLSNRLAMSKRTPVHSFLPRFVPTPPLPQLVATSASIVQYKHGECKPPTPLHASDLALTSSVLMLSHASLLPRPSWARLPMPTSCRASTSSFQGQVVLSWKVVRNIS